MINQKELIEELVDLRGKKIYVEKEISGELEVILNEKIRGAVKFVDTRIRAEIIVSDDLEKSKTKLDEALEVYDFLIEDEEVSWRNDLPLERRFLDINRI